VIPPCRVEEDARSASAGESARSASRDDLLDPRPVITCEIRVPLGIREIRVP
jgi:hypothetical protein